MILSGGVDLLALASSTNRTRIDVMPSWVPDFRVPMRRPCGGFPWETPFHVSKGLNISTSTKAHHGDDEWDSPLTLTGCIVDTIDHLTGPWLPGSIGARRQSRATIGFLNDISNIIWMAGERHKRNLQQDPTSVPIYSDTDLEEAKLCILVADLLQVGTSQITSATSGGGRIPYLAEGYSAIMSDLDRNLVSDTKAFIAFRDSLGVKFSGTSSAASDDFFELLKDVQAPPSDNSTATLDEFNPKDSYYNMMDHQDGTRPFLGEGGYIGLVPQLSEKGDVIVIFRGARFPCVLRKTNTGAYRYSRKGYEIVGEAYVYGVMDGEYVQKQGLAKWEDFELV